MGKLVKCHLYYLFTKTNLIVLIVSMFIVSGMMIGNAESIDPMIHYGGRNNDYFASGYEIVKTAALFDAVFLFGFSFAGENDRYRVLLINNKCGRNKYLLSKLALLLMLYSLIFFLFFFLVVLIGCFYRFGLTTEILLIYGDLWLFGLFYGFLSALTTIISGNFYLSLPLVLLSFIVCGERSGFIAYLLPLLRGNRFVLPFFYYLFLSVLITVVTAFCWQNKDL